MGKLFEVKRAEDLLDAEFIAKWRDRRTLEPFTWTVLQAVLDQFVEAEGPVLVEALSGRLPAHGFTAIREAVAQLDEKDLVVLHNGEIAVAYPFSGTPTAFRLVLPDARDRYAVCAIDALGVAPLLRQPTTIRSHCHHCREPLEIHVRPDGPAGPAEIMVWVGERGEIRKKAYTSL